MAPVWNLILQAPFKKSKKLLTTTQLRAVYELMNEL